MNAPDPEREQRRRIVRQATLWTLIYAASGVGVAVAGAALVAFLLVFAGMPFLATWAVTSVLLLVLPLLALAVRELRAKLSGGSPRRNDG